MAFVGRKAELRRFEEVLNDVCGQAILVVGQHGMGKTMLTSHMERMARDHPKLKCGSVRYDVASTDSVEQTFEAMVHDSFDAARRTPRPFDATTRHRKQWKALLDLFMIGNLVMSLLPSPKRSARDQLLKRLEIISSRMQDWGRALFVIDPEEFMQPDSEQAWAIVTKHLPDKIKLIFTQRPDDVLVTSENFTAFQNVVRIPEDNLGPLDEEAIENLLEIRAPDLAIEVGALHNAIGRYNGHPFAVSAALDLIENGVLVDDLPVDPRGIAQKQWRRICQHSPEAIKLFKTLAILDIPVPNEVVIVVSGLDHDRLQNYLADKYLGSLLEQREESCRIYHSLLGNYVARQISKEDITGYHQRAITEYRRRLAGEGRPDALAAKRLPEHILILEGAEAFVQSFIEESAEPLLDLGMLDVSLGLSERALSCVPADSAEAVVIFRNIGGIHLTRGQLYDAEQVLRKAFEIAERLDRGDLQLSLYADIGLVFQIAGHLEQAEQMCRKALEVSEQNNLVQSAAVQYSKLGLILQARGNLDEAEKISRKSLELYAQLKGKQSEEGVATQYGNLGFIRIERGELEAAERLSRKSLDLYERLGSKEGAAIQYGNLGAIYEKRDQLDDAIQMYRRSIKIREPMGNLGGMAQQYTAIGVVDQKRGDFEEAKGNFLIALEMLERAGNWFEMAEVYSLLGLLYQECEDFDEAERLHYISLQIEQDLGRPGCIAREYGRLAANFKRRGNRVEERKLFEKARDYYRQAGRLDLVEELRCWLEEVPSTTKQPLL